jgi:septal ring factor EnvC (AmiA/AmiB activator)
LKNASCLLAALLCTELGQKTDPLSTRKCSHRAYTLTTRNRPGRKSFAEQRLRERRELEEQEQAFARAKRQRQREEQREQYSEIGQLRAEVAAVQQDVEARYETLVKASGEALGAVANDMHDIIKQIERDIFSLIERRFAALEARLDVVMPESPRPKDFKFASEPDDDPPRKVN